MGNGSRIIGEKISIARGERGIVDEQFIADYIRNELNLDKNTWQIGKFSSTDHIYLETRDGKKAFCP